jgi:cation diffusion facilitator CzcD-associated flavoprotein CzcO
MQQVFEWTVVGAGPAGIASVGKLLDAGVSPSQIAWVDPEFKVGDFGTSWRYVGSNTSVEYFLKYYRHSPSFCYNDMH